MAAAKGRVCCRHSAGIFQAGVATDGHPSSVSATAAPDNSSKPKDVIKVMARPGNVREESVSSGMFSPNNSASLAATARRPRFNRQRIIAPKSRQRYLQIVAVFRPSSQLCANLGHCLPQAWVVLHSADAQNTIE